MSDGTLRLQIRPLKQGELVWVTWTATFVIFEVNGIVNETPGDTLSVGKSQARDSRLHRIPCG